MFYFVKKKKKVFISLNTERCKCNIAGRLACWSYWNFINSLCSKCTLLVIFSSVTMQQSTDQIHVNFHTNSGGNNVLKALQYIWLLYVRNEYLNRLRVTKIIKDRLIGYQFIEEKTRLKRCTRLQCSRTSALGCEVLPCDSRTKRRRVNYTCMHTCALDLRTIFPWNISLLKQMKQTGLQLQIFSTLVLKMARDIVSIKLYISSMPPKVIHCS